MAFSSSSPRLAANASTLMRHNSRSLPSLMTFSIAATTFGSAELRNESNSGLVSVTTYNLRQIGAE